MEYNDNLSESGICIVQAFATLIHWYIDFSSFLLYENQDMAIICEDEAIIIYMCVCI